MDAKLVVVGGKANKAEVQLKLPTVIGRGRDADLTVAHPTVSRHHCVLFEQDGVLFVRDNGSLNGTLIEGNKIQEAQLKPGETLTVGPLTFRADYQLAEEFPGVSDAPAMDDFAETDDATPELENSEPESNGATPESDSAMPESDSAMPTSDAMRESNGTASEETIQFDDAAAIKAPGASAADSTPSFGFLASEPTVEAETDLTPPDSPLADSPLGDSSLDLGPPASMDDDELGFLDDKPDLPPTVDLARTDALPDLEPAASAEPMEFALAASEKKSDVMDDEVLAMLGGIDEKPLAKHVDGVPPIKIGDEGKIGDDGKAGKAAPSAGDDDLNDFFQSLGVK